MFFWILFFIGLLAIAALVAGPVLSLWKRDDDYMICSLVGFFVGIFTAIPTGVIWSDYASDYARVTQQQHRIGVYEERIASLESRLNDFSYPEKPNISLDADTPWASIIEALAAAETKLAEAKDERAIAIRSIEQWRVGPASGVVWFVGDPTGTTSVKDSDQ